MLGWNIVTQIDLASITVRVGRARSDRWVPTFRASIVRASVLAVVWALWVLIGLPLSFD